MRKDAGVVPRRDSCSPNSLHPAEAVSEPPMAWSPHTWLTSHRDLRICSASHQPPPLGPSKARTPAEAQESLFNEQ